MFDIFSQLQDFKPKLEQYGDALIKRFESIEAKLDKVIAHIEADKQDGEKE